MMLDICIAFFDYLNLHMIRYCHWKSNTHLDEALNGKTDLDILVHHKDKEKFRKALDEFQIKLVATPNEKKFPGLEDYLGFDEESGCLIHLHVHFKLILGQKFIKNHHFPVEEVILDNLEIKNNIFVPCPEAELILLIIRAHMKTGTVELIKQAVNDLIGRNYTPFPKQIENEFICLIESSNHKKTLEMLYQLKLPLSEELITDFSADFSDNKLNCYTILSNMFRIFSALRGYRRRKNFLVYFKYSYFLFRSLPLIRKFFKEKMTIVGTGKTFSFVGADGSGKSTLVEDVEKWLSWRLSVVTYYHGIPKTVLKHFIPFTIRQLRKLKLDFLAIFLDCLYMIYLAKRRYKTSLLSKRDNLSGKIVFTDRFPLKEFNKMPEPMDGPQLLKYTTKVGRSFSKIELNYYEKILCPDMLFIMQADIKELRRRKDDLPLEYHKIKADAVNSLKSDLQTALIDANKPYSDVLLEVKKNIWELI
jgi:deoxyadenosine/deoxycytidine kinase